MVNYDNYSKNISRVFATSRNDGHWQTALMMPSTEALDLHLGREQGWFHPSKTRIDAVEKDPDTYGRMCENLLRHEFENVLPHLNRIERMKLYRSYDLMWIDLCGELNHEIGTWLKNEAIPHLAPGGTFSITFSNSIRGNNTMMCEARANIETKWKEDFLRFRTEHPSLKELPMDKHIPLCLTMYLIEKFVLKGMDFDYGLLLNYRDSYTMGVARWNNVRKSEEKIVNGLDSATTIAQVGLVPTGNRNNGETTMAAKTTSQKSSNRSQASFKANVTRKKAANQALFEAGQLTKGQLSARNAAVTRQARQNGWEG